MKKKKRVLVVGAGFSLDAGYPKQSDILNELQKSGGHIDVESIKFVRGLFPLDSEPTLEDLFTLLDQAIENQINCGRFNWKELEDGRNKLNSSILSLLHKCATCMTNAEFYRSVAAEMILSRILKGLSGDPFSVISLNWDTLLEDSIYWCIENTGLIRKIDIDYGCYTSPLEPSPHITSLRQKPSGIFNLKLIKLHGSANWRICQACNRLFTNIGVKDELWDFFSLRRPCPECEKLYPDLHPEKQPQLEPFFITPTYVKKFNNPHIQMTWHNAYIELSEANEVIFAGYSLPEADYHLRGLLIRAIQPDAKIIVITLDSESEDAKRYKKFFGKQCVKIYEGGIRGYYDSLDNIKTLAQLLDKIKKIYLRSERTHDS